MSSTTYSDLCLFRRMPNTNNSRRLLVEYIQKHRLPIKFNNTQSFVLILKAFNSFYNNKIRKIQSLFRSYTIRKKYNLILSSYANIPFRLSTTDNYCDLTIFNGNFPVLERKLINNNNLIDNSDITSLDPDILFVCKDRGNLYAFDLREINQIKPLMNPYTNKKFEEFNQMLIKARLEQCPKDKLKIEPLIINNLDIKINSLINLLESNRGLYIDINGFKQSTAKDLRDLITKMRRNPCINRILKTDHKKLLSSLQPKEKYIDLLLYVAEYQDKLKNERCLAISDLIQDQLDDQNLESDNSEDSIYEDLADQSFDDFYMFFNRTPNFDHDQPNQSNNNLQSGQNSNDSQSTQNNNDNNTHPVLIPFQPISPLVEYSESDTDIDSDNDIDININVHDLMNLDTSDNNNQSNVLEGSDDDFWNFLNPIAPIPISANSQTNDPNQTNKKKRKSSDEDLPSAKKQKK